MKLDYKAGDRVRLLVPREGLPKGTETEILAPPQGVNVRVADPEGGGDPPGYWYLLGEIQPLTDCDGPRVRIKVGPRAGELTRIVEFPGEVPGPVKVLSSSTDKVVAYPIGDLEELDPVDLSGITGEAAGGEDTQEIDLLAVGPEAGDKPPPQTVTLDAARMALRPNQLGELGEELPGFPVGLGVASGKTVELRVQRKDLVDKAGRFAEVLTAARLAVDELRSCADLGGATARARTPRVADQLDRALRALADPSLHSTGPRSFGELVENERERRELSVLDWAALLGIPARVVEDLEAGVRPPTFGELRILVQAGLDPTALLGLNYAPRRRPQA